MTSKEKAVELIDLFTFNCKECDNAKMSALIAVEEIIEHCNYANKWYWQEVKQEIEKL